MNSTGAPSPRGNHHAVMLGNKIVVFGGGFDLAPLADGGIYDVTTDTWEELPLDECAPPARIGDSFTAFGNGRQALRWGGALPTESAPAPDQPIEQGWIFTL